MTAGIGFHLVLPNLQKRFSTIGAGFGNNLWFSINILAKPGPTQPSAGAGFHVVLSQSTKKLLTESS
jgi:hypothetical protein